MSTKFEMLARWGYAARGIVYFILGVIALLGSSSGGREASPEGALSLLLRQPFGRILLAAVAIGLVGHVAWRLAQAILNADHQDGNAKGYVARAGNLASGLANGALAFAATRLVIQTGGDSGGDGQKSLVALLMQQPLGRAMVGGLGVAIMAAGAAQIWRGISGKYRNVVELPPGHEKLLGGFCVFGLAARGVLLIMTGGFFIFAAFTVDPDQAGGVTEALDWVHGLPFGSYLYGVAAAGLLAFGIYSFIEARYRKVDAPDTDRLKRMAEKAVS